MIPDPTNQRLGFVGVPRKEATGVPSMSQNAPHAASLGRTRSDTELWR
jgi:hypothetical protein